MMGDPSKLTVIRKVAALSRIFPTLDLSVEEKVAPLFLFGSGTCHVVFAEFELLKLQKNGQFPDESVRIKV
jgi:hypothetical protein